MSDGVLNRPTLTQRTLSVVERSPGMTAYEIAFQLDEVNRYTSISSILTKLTDNGKVARKLGPSARGELEKSYRYTIAPKRKGN